MSGTREKEGLEDRPLAEHSMPGSKGAGIKRSVYWVVVLALCAWGTLTPAADNLLLGPGFEAGARGLGLLMGGTPWKAGDLGLSTGQALW